MFVTNHALAGAAVGLVLRRPAAAFATGIASHVAMDMVHQWGEPGIDWDDFLKVARVDGVVGIAKAYATRVGGGGFATELLGDAGDALRKAGNEFGTVTGRPRRCGWFDLPLMNYAHTVNHLTTLVIT